MAIVNTIPVVVQTNNLHRVLECESQLAAIQQKDLYLNDVMLIELLI